MADNEQELKEINELLVRASLVDGFAQYITPATIERIAKEVIAKLKALGYEQVWEKCPDCNGRGKDYRVGGFDEDFADCPTCKGTGRITNKVEWDREKVALKLAKDAGFFDSRGWDAMPKPAQEVFGEVADQLKEMLTK